MKVRKPKTGSARIKISDSNFGERFLGGEDFCIFPNQESARQEIFILQNTPDNSAVIDEWEIHVLRNDGNWVMENAGQF